MRRYTNWGLVFLGGLFSIAALSSPLWIPVVQPYLVEEEAEEALICREYVPPAQCDLLREIYLVDPESAERQMELMSPENSLEVRDPELNELAIQLRDSINSSDTPEISDVHVGVFNPPIDAIHNATGEVQVVSIVSSDLTVVRYFVRLQGRGDGNFLVTNGPDLRIYLSQHSDPRTPEEAFEEFGAALEVERLKGNSGRQNYLISQSVDLSVYRSLVIYSPELDQIYGVAPFIVE